MKHTQVSFPRLEPFRALCFLAVFGCHTFYTTDPVVVQDPVWRFIAVGVFGPGWLGVNMFFVLSGFLITYLLAAEQRINQRIDVPRFWLRRILRIWPLYFVVVLIGFLLVPWVKDLVGIHDVETGDPWHYILFYCNFDRAAGIMPTSSTLGVLWSIAVEEQFYLVWPLLILVSGRRLLPVLCTAMIVGSVLFRVVNDDIAMRQWHTFSCIGDMACGGLGAAFLSMEKGRSFLQRMGATAIILWHVVLLVLFLFSNEVQSWPGGGVWFPMLFASVTMVVILLQCAGGKSMVRLPSAGPLAAMGRISYGLYCLHQIALLAILQLMPRLDLGHEVWHVTIIQPLLTLALSIVLAMASHRFLERPFLKLKDRFAYIVRGSSGSCANIGPLA